MGRYSVSVGDELNLVHDGGKVKLLKKLKEGGQGKIFLTNYDGKKYVVKWYNSFHGSSPTQRKLIDELVSLAPRMPDEFVWPQDIVVKPPGKGEGFGYLMPFVDLKNNVTPGRLRKERSKIRMGFDCQLLACINLVRAFQIIHLEGLCYRDMSWDNCAINPNDGSVFIIDNDNVAPTSMDLKIVGTSGFMAPEVAQQGKKPSPESDQYSLAILIFMVLFREHPNHGAYYDSLKVWDDSAKQRVYSKDPVFVFDPSDRRNKCTTKDMRRIWKVQMPENLKKLFIRSFCDGAKNPEKRVTEQEWLSALSTGLRSMFNCNHCGLTLFYDRKNDSPTRCPRPTCDKTMDIPIRLVVKNRYLVCKKGANIRSALLKGNYRDINPIGEVVVKKNKRGIKNISGHNWTMKKDGDSTFVPNNKHVSTEEGITIDFGAGVIGKFEK